jgi:hypothetical protein
VVVIGAPIMLGRCASLPRMRASLCYELISSVERERERERKHVGEAHSVLATATLLLLRQNSVTAHARHATCVSPLQAPQSALRPVCGLLSYSEAGSCIHCTQSVGFHRIRNGFIVATRIVSTCVRQIPTLLWETINSTSEVISIN